MKKRLLHLAVLLLTSVMFSASAAKPVGIWKGNSWNRLGELVIGTVFNPQWTKDKPLTVNFTGKEFNKVSAVIYMHGTNPLRFREWNKNNIPAMEDFVKNGGTLVIIVDGAITAGNSNTGTMATLLGAKNLTPLKGKPQIVDKSWANCGAIPEVFMHMLAPMQLDAKGNPQLQGTANTTPAISATPNAAPTAKAAPLTPDKVVQKPLIALSGLTTAKTIIGNANGAIVAVNSIGKGKVYFINVRLTQSYTSYRQPYNQIANAAWEQYLPFAQKIHSIVMAAKPALSTEKREIWDPKPLGPKARPLTVNPRTPAKLVSARKFTKLPGQDIVLIADGKPQALMVNTMRGTGDAFATLNNLLFKMSGTRLPVAAQKAVGSKDGGWSWKRNVYPVKIVFAKSAHVEIIASGNTITISAPELSLGVQTFMREILGYRMLWPGEDGECFTKSKTVKFAPFKLYDKSPMRMRAFRNGLTCGKYPWRTPEGKIIQVNARPGLSKGCDILGIDVPHAIKLRSLHRTWAAPNRLGGGLNEGGGVNFYPWQKRYGKSNKQVLALQFETVRRMKTAHVRICKSNPETIRLAVKEAVERLNTSKYANVEYYRFSPSDGGYDIMCMCENCRKWDPQDGKRGTSRVYLGRNRPVFPYVRMTDRVLRFTCEAARELQKQKPGMKVVFLAYASYFMPPEYYHDVPDNILVTFVGGEYLNESNRQRALNVWKYWSSVAKELCWRPNFLGGGNGLPFVYVHTMGEDLKHFASTGMVGGDFDTLPHNWAVQSLNYYVLANLLWDPSTPVDALVDDFCQKGFGAGADDMKAFYRYNEDLTNAYAQRGGESIKVLEDLTLSDSGTWRHKFLRVFTPAAFDKLESYLAAARSKVAEDSPERRRIDFVAAGIGFTRRNAEFWMKYYKTPAKERKNLRKDIDALVKYWVEFFNRYPYAINVPSMASGHYYSFFRNCGWKPIRQFAK